MRFYRISGPRLWGDYGSILVHGMSRHLPRFNGRIQLERTGPFIPPITFPGVGDVVVTDGFRGKLEHSGFVELAYALVIKARIVEYHWELWDRNAEAPSERPLDGEPESYILGRPHVPEVAEQLGPLWEVILPEDAAVDGVRIHRGVYEYRINPSTWRGLPLFRATGKRHVMATEEAKGWLEENAEGWIEFQEAMPSG